MSHSKLDKQPLIQRTPELSRFIVRCAACGRTGLDASLDWESDEWLTDKFGPPIKRRMLRHYDVLPLGPDGLCETCGSAFAQFASQS